MIFSIVAILVLTGTSWGAPQNKTVLQDLATDLENWMSLLPDDLKQVPLNLLAIPGKLALLYYYTFICMLCASSVYFKDISSHVLIPLILKTCFFCSCNPLLTTVALRSHVIFFLALPESF